MAALMALGSKPGAIPLYFDERFARPITVESINRALYTARKDGETPLYIGEVWAENNRSVVLFTGRAEKGEFQFETNYYLLEEENPVTPEEIRVWQEANSKTAQEVA